MKNHNYIIICLSLVKKKSHGIKNTENIIPNLELFTKLYTFNTIDLWKFQDHFRDSKILYRKPLIVHNWVFNFGKIFTLNV